MKSASQIDHPYRIAVLAGVNCRILSGNDSQDPPKAFRRSGDQATSLKLPEGLKRRIERLAGAANKTPHAFMVEALKQEADRAEIPQRIAFVPAARQ
jgi:hypothetical protein